MFPKLQPVLRSKRGNVSPRLFELQAPPTGRLSGGVVCGLETPVCFFVVWVTGEWWVVLASGHGVSRRWDADWHARVQSGRAPVLDQSAVRLFQSNRLVPRSLRNCFLVKSVCYIALLVFFLDLRKFRTYKGGSVRDLLRAMRNKVRAVTPATQPPSPPVRSLPSFHPPWSSDLAEAARP